MFDFLGKRLQKSLSKIQAKTILTEVDILEITREIKLALLEADVNFLVVKDFIKSIKDKIIGSELVGKLNPSEQMIKIVNEELTNILGKNSKNLTLKTKPTVVMMTGLQGSGKTTTCAKLVKYFLDKQMAQKPLMIAGDIYRPAAIEQLITLGKSLKIDVFTKSNQTVQSIVDNGLKKAKLENYDLVIIDTAGRLSINEELMQELIDVKKISHPQEILFIADALSGQDIINVATTFNQKLTLTGLIITKLDSDARGGAALSITHLLNLPILFIGTGEKINNLELFYPDRMAGRILGMGDIKSLSEKAQDVFDEKGSKRMMNRMATGNFDLNDLLEQLRQMKKMGKMSKVLQMIPGMANKISSDKIQSAEKRLALFEILISSMTQKERNFPKLLKNSDRKKRIMKGSGRNAQEYNLLVNEFERVSKQMKQISQSLKDGSFNPNKFGIK